MTNEKFDGTSKIIVGGIVNRYELEEFYNILETEKKNFDNYIIAYIDFLGIKEKMKNDSSYEVSVKSLALSQNEAPLSCDACCSNQQAGLLTMALMAPAVIVLYFLLHQVTLAIPLANA